ncbi:MULTISPECIES: MFS transporter [Pseudomonas]|jgi:predicted MFS family arabinose efflux permease|uniref:Major facilitator family transporter n=2 Tax=Pseudomonas putida group TaxID=136845 RepID=Q88QI9_PSEPK|nr:MULTISPECIES: MFS transporter [Pseudomonas]AAN66131.1 Major facilitator family transporter [Pseudomonas putida KT2440]KMU94130.1 major facilitator transporter [Pseudomonas putida]KMY37528.1 major facilitator transporter [Pseudomonas putida]MBP2841815.1 MFS transporter [Pseudomonas sp. PNP]MCE0861859.1 MFS transporter [Pseudomonas alloputida]
MTPSLTRWITLLLATTSAMAVATVYFAQPLLESMAAELGVAQQQIGWVVGATQAGYALGLLLIVPLGDLVDRKRLLLGQLLFAALALVGVGMAPNWAILLLALAITGLMAVMVQVMVAHAASLASPGQQGQAVGTVTSGVVLGILLARLASGGLADLAGWRSVYLASAGLLMLLALVLWRSLPGGQPMGIRPGYRALIVAQFSLYRHDRLLRQRGVFGVLIFAAFSVLWSAMVMPLSAAPLTLSHTEIGLFGLAGVAGTLAASHAGRLADLGRGECTTGVSLALLTLSWLPTAFVEHSLLAFVLGVLMLDFAVQAVHVTNQSLLLAGRGAMASRLIGAYMCCYSLGSGLGAVLASWVFAHWGWVAVCGLGMGISAAALCYWLWLQRARAAEAALQCSGQNL